MKTLERILAVLTKNLGLTIVLVLAVILFAIFADGLIGGIITAISALLAYTCVERHNAAIKKKKIFFIGKTFGLVLYLINRFQIYLKHKLCHNNVATTISDKYI